MQCAYCGKKNRLPDAPRQNGRYHCANCKNDLLSSPHWNNPADAVYIKPGKSHSARRRVLFAFGLAGAFVLGCLTVAALFPRPHQVATFLPKHSPKPRTARAENRPVWKNALAGGRKNAVAPIPALPPKTQIVIEHPVHPQVLRETPSYIPVALPPNSEEEQPDHLPVSLPNGTILVQNASGQGLGKLQINNGTPEDAVVKLVGDPTLTASTGNLPRLSQKTYHSIYVRSSDTATIPKIDPGGYRILFCLGSDWKQATGQFSQGVSYSQFEQPVIFDEIPSASEGQHETSYHVFHVTLNAVPDGTARTSEISGSDFNRAD